jgi:hypothetical protein
MSEYEQYKKFYELMRRAGQGSGELFSLFVYASNFGMAKVYWKARYSFDHKDDKPEPLQERLAAWKEYKSGTNAA